ncbi:hypothetical protein FOS14_07785 [Skermania sp. ID1734]|uniref:hypothetical protein n=1 Tax=Skermania sp. ID1734 TaxID=2597516 RepID=UPI00117BEE1D|nr:hypothetical protein [Skermania sp. ID1734]TSE00320.1 hypothetical protein FOS14_07785 [Skermania sp. ID1734]
MVDVHRQGRPRGGMVRIPRSRGAVSGFLLVLLGIWGALIPFIGPLVHWAYTPDVAWTWTSARGWLEVLPGAVTFFAGLILLQTANRAVAHFAGWLAAASGAWFVIGYTFAGPIGGLGSIGDPVATGAWKTALLIISYFTGLGAAIIFLSAFVLGRMSVRSVRDLAYAQTVEPAVARRGPVARHESAVAEPVRHAHPGEAPVAGPSTAAAAAPAAGGERVAPPTATHRADEPASARDTAATQGGTDTRGGTDARGGTQTRGGTLLNRLRDRMSRKQTAGHGS